MEASISPDVWVVEDLQQQKLPARSLVAAFRRAGVSARLVDLNQGVADLVATARREQPRLILGSVLFADRVDEHLGMLTALRAAGVRAHLTVTGHVPALAAKAFLNACPALDFVLCGEAERIAAQWAGGLDQPEAWARVPGLVGRETEASTGPATATLESLAFPSYDTVPLFRGNGYATVEASRGCYHACDLCLPRASYARWGAGYRSRSVASLIEEVERLYRRGVRLFLFDDEQFLPPGRAREARVEALADELARKNLRIAFTIKCRADDVEPAVFRRLKEMGLVRVYVGIESGCQATLDILGKQTTVQQNVDALAMLNELGIVADWRALVVHPWSTQETLEIESTFFRRVLPYLDTVIDWREVEAYAGTPLAERLSWEERGNAEAWSIQYTLSDPRAELVRRLSRLVFWSDAYRRLEESVTEAWFEVLLARRLESGQSAREAEAELRAAVARANGESLEVWDEMLDYTRIGDVYNADGLNARASEWVARINFTCHTSLVDRSSGL